MNLVIDIGNSRTKVALFSGQEMAASFVFKDFSESDLAKLRKEYPFADTAIISTVANDRPPILDYLRANFRFMLELTHQTRVPVRNAYLSPETLGLDRLAAAIGARELFPNQDLLVIDAGTAITFDLMDHKGTFCGGNISPGLKSRFRALHEFTQRLPLTDETGPCPLIGRTTEEAIRSGVVNGMIAEIDGMIERLKDEYPDLVPVLTGGDAQFFERRLKNHIFVKFDITLVGLNRILEYNVEKL